LNPAEDFHAELIQGQNLIGQTGICHEPGHSPNHARRLILGQDLPAGLANMFATPQPILAHPGHHHDKGVSFVDVGHRPKEHVHSRAAGVFRRALVSAKRHLMVVTCDDHMVVARSYPSAARLQGSSRVTLFHAYLRLRSQALRQEAGKYRWHVLNDNHGDGKVAR
jgi:hypothetical protein